MRKNVIKMVFLILLVSFSFVCLPVYAWQTGGYTGGGGSAGGGTSINAMTDGGSGFDSGVYLFQLVYRPQNKNFYQVGKCVVVNTNQQGKYKIRDINRKARSTAEANGCTYGSKNGSLLSLAKEINDKGGLDNVQIVSKKEYAEKLVSEFNLNFNDLTLSGSTPGKYNSHGYRILVQKLTCFGYSSSDLSTWCAVLWPRKSWASQNPSLGLFGGSFQGDLYTTQDDIGIRNAKGRSSGWYATTGNGSELGKAFADVNRGEGYNIIGFDDKIFGGYDYTIDAACVNCNSTDEENKAYIIQDTNDWEAILASANSENKNVRGYYKKGNGVYCREEYWVYLPNQNNIIYVEPGRYFTLNPSASDLNNVSTSATPNFKPVKVVKKRQCRVNSEENNGNVTNILNNFRVNSEPSFKSKAGTVKFKYNERYDESNYNMDDAESLIAYDEGNNYKYSISNNELSMEITKYYTLPDNYYQYIRKQDGLSMKTKPSSNLNHYINVGISNLPISFNNTGESSNGDVAIAADIQFLYELPGKNKDTDNNSLMYKAYTEKNDYLGDKNKQDNIYVKDLNNSLESNKQYLIENSACAKMFGYKTSAFKTCAENRKNNKIGDGSANCITNSNIKTRTTAGYSCMVLTREDASDCKTEEDAKRLGLDWNPYNNTCCPVGTYYNPNLGKCSNDTCRIENGKYYDYDGKEITKEEYDRICPYGCKIENGKYYDFEGKEITKEEYDRICPSDIPPVCPEDECPYGCCPSGECAPMSTINGEPICPGGGGIDVIYRTIDLKNPFPGQNAEQRHTGSNWCNYNIRTQQIECEYNNPVSNEYIIRERGGNVNGGKVYREGHVLYEVTLDTATINSIRSYNDDNKYDDWDLNCDDDGKACISDFLRKEVDVTGECARVSKSNFYDCDEDV